MVKRVKRKRKRIIVVVSILLILVLIFTFFNIFCLIPKKLLKEFFSLLTLLFLTLNSLL